MGKISFQKQYSVRSRTFAALAITAGFFLCQGAAPASAQTIVDEWATVQAPKPPELKPVTLDPKQPHCWFSILLNRPVMPRGGRAA